VWLLLFAAGFSLAALDAYGRLHPGLAPQYEGIPLAVVGVVDALPHSDGRILRFELKVEQGSSLDGKPIELPRRLRLAWYQDQPSALVPGQRWHLRVKLKRPRALSNPGGFDYEKWLFQQGIGATGYVRSAGDNRLLQPVVGGYGLMRLRYRIAQQLSGILDEQPMAGLVTALAIGERGGISDSQWDVLLATGTNHLVAISGLHVGLVAGLMFFLWLRLWRLCPTCCLRLAAPRAASVIALSAALGYAALAGFSIPTQRALVMLAVVLGALWWQSPVKRSRVLLLALWAVLLIDPASVLSSGFWLSFAAVVWILYGMSGRIQTKGLWWRWGRVQFLVSAGLLPLLLLFFQQGSLSAPIANLVAVPYVSFLIVPLTLAGIVSLGLPAVGSTLLLWAADLLQWLWPFLHWLNSAIPVLPVAVAGWALWPALVGLVWFFAPQGWPLRPAGLLLLLPLFLWRPSMPVGTARFTLLDVGQGLSAVVQTRHHVLIYDAGPRYPSGFDTGDAVVVPFLRAEGIRQVDTLVVSHSGNDHSGGAPSVLSQIPVKRLLTNVVDLPGEANREPCQRDLVWQWDGVTFRVLHPASADLSPQQNNHSCVLRIDAGNDALLLTADIEAEAERALLRSEEPLEASILVVPHHGSKTSSTPDFVTAVRPRYALFAVGYRNRYGFPLSKVVARYRKIGASILRSDRNGALTFMLGAGKHHPQAYRHSHPHIWQRQ
jgi:competence protein ComEC